MTKIEYIIYGILSAIIIIEFIYILLSRKVVAGTLHIDSSRDSKIVCLFTLDQSIELLEKKKTVIVKIDTEHKLKEWEN